MSEDHSKYWKAFEKNPITHSAAHYLMAVDDLLNEKGYARLTDLAKRLDITAGSCSITLRKLKAKGLVETIDNKFLKLSKEGAMFVQIVRKNDELLESFLIDVLGVSKKQAQIDACKMEHLLSMEASFKLAGFIKFVQSEDGAAKEFLKKLGEQDPVCWKDFEVN